MIGWVNAGEQGLMRSAGCLELFEGCGEFNVKKDRKPPGVMRPQSTFPLTPRCLRDLFLLLPLGLLQLLVSQRFRNAAVAASSREISSLFGFRTSRSVNCSARAESFLSVLPLATYTPTQSFPNPTTANSSFFVSFLFKASSIVNPSRLSPLLVSDTPTLLVNQPQTNPVPDCILVEVILSRCGIYQTRACFFLIECADKGFLCGLLCRPAPPSCCPTFCPSSS